MNQPYTSLSRTLTAMCEAAHAIATDSLISTEDCALVKPLADAAARLLLAVELSELENGSDFNAEDFVAEMRGQINEPSAFNTYTLCEKRAGGLMTRLMNRPDGYSVFCSRIVPVDTPLGAENIPLGAGEETFTNRAEACARFDEWVEWMAGPPKKAK